MMYRTYDTDAGLQQVRVAETYVGGTGRLLIVNTEVPILKVRRPNGRIQCL